MDLKIFKQMRSFAQIEREVLARRRDRRPQLRPFPLLLFLDARKAATSLPDALPVKHGVLRHNHRWRPADDKGRPWRRPRRNPHDLRPGTRLYWWRERVRGWA